MWPECARATDKGREKRGGSVGIDSGKNEGKGGGGEGKGEQGGKAAGKGFHRDCDNCGEWGHSKRFCQQAQGKGGSYGTRPSYEVEEREEELDEEVYEVEERDVHAGWCSMSCPCLRGGISRGRR